ncbi:hypothetical protein [Ezakiella coagulans]|uniref:hypothetical protein n=1 Tax=Ezakiella coagulans TaxID=46507 RepID=UPI0028895660|nr:hypothetical protein [Ezakiella coagulans]
MRKRNLTNLIIFGVLTAVFVAAGILIGKNLKLLQLVGGYLVASSILFGYAKWIKREFIVIFLVTLILFALELILIIKSAGLGNTAIKIWTVVVTILFVLNYIGTLVSFLHRRINPYRVMSLVIYTFFHIVIGYIIYTYISFIFLI